MPFISDDARDQKPGGGAADDRVFDCRRVWRQ
jgi:hypothetical protein